MDYCPSVFVYVGRATSASENAHNKLPSAQEGPGLIRSKPYMELSSAGLEAFLISWKVFSKRRWVQMSEGQRRAL